MPIDASISSISNLITLQILRQFNLTNYIFLGNAFGRMSNMYEKRTLNGNALTKCTYPIGKPTYYAPNVNSAGMTLKQFLLHYGDELVDGLYKIVVSGKLSNPQVFEMYNCNA